MTDNSSENSIVSIDCEMVGVGPGDNEDALARVTIVDYHFKVILDKYVQVKDVTDYRTRINGITPKLLANSYRFEDVQHEVAELISDRIVVGHSLHHDLEMLKLYHPRELKRDTSLLNINGSSKTPSLKKLAKKKLGITTIQKGEHSSAADALVCMLLYRKHESKGEKMIPDF
ncbi:ribonuclease H-like protein [Gigaspora margarita]|uniref:Ribonuclease H-like protein n=1 Tax=Gigaspora margarita TaxID=4874 RepID=A0A8H4A6C9_GIGMA|nr:ribonuclease H-like protein [Gigaspora margarita]